MKEARKVTIHDAFTGMTIKVNSIYEANKWFFNNNISKNKTSAYANIYNSLEKKRIIFGHYFITEDKE